MALPTAFIDRVERELGRDQAERIVASMSQPKRTAWWINPLRENSSTTLPPGKPLPGLPGVMTCPPDERQFVVRHPATTAGRIYPMNPSSVVAVHALAPSPGEEILDLAAAPGGKSILIAAKMDNTGRLALVESVRKRFLRMRANLDRCGVALAKCYLDDGRRTGGKTPERFDRVLLDAPCSSEGRFRADDAETTHRWRPRKVVETSRKQRALIDSAFRCLKPGGVLVYCTCTFALKENEEVVEWLLRRHEAAELRPFRIDGVPGEEGALAGTLRIVPDDIFDGFFVAVIHKSPLSQ